MNPSKRISTSHKRSKSQQETYPLHINKAPDISALSESFIPTKGLSESFTWGSCLMTLNPPSQESTLIRQHRQDFEKQIRQSAFCGNDEAPVVAQTKTKNSLRWWCLFFRLFCWLKLLIFLRYPGMMLKICKSRKVLEKNEYQSRQLYLVFFF